MLLCGDIGGTKTTLALVTRERPHEAVRLERYPSQEAAGLTTLLDRFLGAAPAELEAACFGAAGPVSGEVIDTTNLPWDLDARALRQHLGVPVFLLNDLEALAHGVPAIDPATCAILNAGRAYPTGTIAVIAAGTGLGLAGLVWDGRRHMPFASEGGHRDFAPRSAREMELLRYLLGRFEHVSCERLISGPGLVNIFEFLRDVEKLAVPDPLARALAEGDPAAAVTQAGLSGSASIAVAALDIFAGVYGAEAGNLALTLKATGGVYVGGGIAPKILPKLQEGGFREGFLAKGRFREFLSGIPLLVILEEKTALFGAARYAAQLLEEKHEPA